MNQSGEDTRDIDNLLGEKVPPHLVLLNGLQKGAQLFPIQNLLWEVIGL